MPSDPCVGLTLFKTTWQKTCPDLVIMTPRTDVCERCESLRQNIMSSITEEDKVESTRAFQEHLSVSQEHRLLYSTAITRSYEALKSFTPAERRPGTSVPACSKNISLHYTFDFAQQLQLPYYSRQVGPIYFKTPRKVQLFGVCCDGAPYQVNYLVDEACTIGENGSKSHGANSVVSMLHHFFETHSLGESKLELHADNCGGQNKNKTVVAYLCWRCIVGLHREILYTFMPAGHTRCQVDGFFGLIKQRYRRSYCDTLQHVEEVVNNSSFANFSQLYADPQTGEKHFEWRMWDDFLQSRFKRIPGIRELCQMRFTADEPGIVYYKKSLGGDEVKKELNSVQLSQITSAVLPPAIQPPGLTQERRKYLYEQIRPHVTPQFRDILFGSPQQ